MDSAQIRRYKIVKTILMNLAPVSLGLYLEIAGPTLPDLKHKLGVNYEEIARTLVARSIGYFLSSAVAGVAADFFPRHIELLIAVSLTLGAVGTGLAPWSTNLAMLGVFFHIQGLGQGAIDSFGNCLCARMWGKRASLPLHGLHLGFGIGALIAPQLSRPFISEIDALSDVIVNGDFINGTGSSIVGDVRSRENSDVMHELSFESESWNGSMTSSTPRSIEQAPFYIPYFISSILTATFAAMYFFFYCFEKCNGISTYSKSYEASHGKTRNSRLSEVELKMKNEPEKRLCAKDDDTKQQGEKCQDETSMTFRTKLSTTFDPSSCAQGDRSFGIVALVLVFLYYMNIVGGERVCSKFIYAYALESDNGLDKDGAALVNSLFWIFFTAGRIVAVLLAKYVHPRNFIVVNLALNIVSGLALSVFAFESVIVLYVFTSLLGMVLSPLFPNCLAWINLYLELKGMAVALVFIGSACGGMIYQWLGGFLLEFHGPQAIMYIILGYAVTLSSVYGLLLLLVRNRPTRFKNAPVSLESEKSAL